MNCERVHGKRLMAQWIGRLPTEQEIQGSNPCKTYFQISYNGQYNTLWPCKSRFDSGCLHFFSEDARGLEMAPGERHQR